MSPTHPIVSFSCFGWALGWMMPSCDVIASQALVVHDGDGQSTREDCGAGGKDKVPLHEMEQVYNSA